MVVVLDCNIWVTLTINRQLDFIATLFEQEIEIASCDALKNEIFDVLSRPKFNKYIDYPDILKVVALHDLVTSYHKPGKILPVTKDPKDDYLFALAVKSKANYLVTGDKLLLDIAQYKNTSVVTLNSFRSIVSIS